MAGRAPNWTKDELAILMEGHQLPSDDLAKDLPRRSVGAIDTVRAFIHALHRGQNSSGLSKTARAMIAAQEGRLTCAVCGESF